jgi:hypothetical protein
MLCSSYCYFHLYQLSTLCTSHALPIFRAKNCHDYDISKHSTPLLPKNKHCYRNIQPQTDLITNNDRGIYIKKKKREMLSFTNTLTLNISAGNHFCVIFGKRDIMNGGFPWYSSVLLSTRCILPYSATTGSFHSFQFALQNQH